MTFTLTESLIDSIIFAMEDQNTVWLVNAKTGSIENGEGADFEDALEDELLYHVPRWDSSDGYELLEAFTRQVYSPEAHQKLRSVLESGRGVFRNFKSVLRLYPHVEAKWHSFKHTQMKARVISWYNDLRDSWGLEALEYSEEEETDELLSDDFLFSEYDFAKDGKQTERIVYKMAEEVGEEASAEVKGTLIDIGQNLSRFSKPESKLGFVCRSQQDEFIGAILVALCPSSQNKTALLTDFFVQRQYRGLGIGKELLFRCRDFLKKRGVCQMVIANTVVSDAIKPLLERFSFNELGAVLISNLTGTSKN